MSSVWVMASPPPKSFPAPGKNSHQAPKGNFYYGHIHNQQDYMDRAGYKTAMQHNGHGGKSMGSMKAHLEKNRGVKYWEYSTPHHRSRYRADAKLSREGSHESEVHWTHNNEPGQRGHAVKDDRTHGQESKSSHLKKQQRAAKDHTEDRHSWILAHNRDPRAKTHWETVGYDPSTSFMMSDAQAEWARNHAAQRGHLATNGSVPVDEAPAEEEDAQKKPFTPTEADMAVQPEDYELTDAQLTFEMRKALECEDATRLEALKIVKSLRDGPREVKKERRAYAKTGSTMRMVDDWMDEDTGYRTRNRHH